MPESPSQFARDGRRLTRRAWVVGTLAGGFGLRAIARGAEPDPAAAAEVQAVQARAKAVKLRGFKAGQTEHYLAIGNAPDAFRKQALKICKDLGAAYHDHFRKRNFLVTLPDHRLTIVTLKDRPSYEAFLGAAVGAEVGGHYDLESNRLVIFDFRPDGNELAVAPERINTFTLVHEGLHQLTFNSGLLDRQGDVPVCISEGLATYGERWQAPPHRNDLGLVNKARADVIAGQPNGEWIPLDRLLTEDKLFETTTTEQLAYAQAWAFVYYMMKPSPRVARFRAYLEAIAVRRDAKQRLADAKKHLGDLNRLDNALRSFANRA